MGAIIISTLVSVIAIVGYVYFAYYEKEQS